MKDLKLLFHLWSFTIVLANMLQLFDQKLFCLIKYRLYVIYIVLYNE